jgi:NitT/TauT family transport system permease protein
MRRALRRGAMVSAQIAFVVLLVLAWRAYTHNAQRAFSFGTPSGTWHQLQSWLADGSIWHNIATTLLAAVVGYVIAVVVGAAVGIVIGLVPYLDKILSPMFAFWNGFPRLVYYPFFALALGYSIVSRMMLVAFVIIFMVIVNTAAGVREVDPVVVQNMQMLGARRGELIRSVYLPSAAVWIMTSARLTVGWALQAAIVAEFIGATAGLGYLTVTGQNDFNTNEVWAATFVVLVIAVVVDRFLYLVQRRLTRWMPAT